MNDVDARAWLADVLARIADHPAKQIADLLPWNWKAALAATVAAANPPIPAALARCLLRAGFGRV